MLARIWANGVDVAYRLDGPADAEVIVLGNGLAMDMSMWEPQAEALSGRYRILRYDHRGHGGSTATPGDYSLDLLAEDASSLLDALGIGRAHLLGTSLGAMVWLNLALMRPDLTLSLSVCATTVHPPWQAWADRVELTRRAGVAPQARSTVQRWFTPEFHAANPGVVQSMLDMIVRTSVDGMVGCATAIRDMTLADRIGEIRRPTLVIAGDHDLVTPLRDLRFIVDAVPAATLVRMARSAHMPTIEQSADCNAAVLSFLSGITASPDASTRGTIAP